VKLAPTEASPPRPTHDLRAQFGQAIELIGYDLRDTADGLQVVLYWHDLAPIDASYTVFVHVADASGKVVAQHDGPPRSGRYPTNAWAPGESTRDSHTVDVSTLKPGHYRVLVGLYLPESGRRLPVVDGPRASTTADEVILAEWDRT
jgi:hypothetical protein